MQAYVIDIEANGLQDTVTKIHCAVAISLDAKETLRFKPDEMDEFVSFLKTVDVWVGHNIIQYDIPVIEKILGYSFEGKRVDTMLMSRLQNPKRPIPYHAKNKAEAMKTHGLYAWGVRVGIDKPEIERWDEYTPEILHRCEEDVRINLAVYKELRKEAEGVEWRNTHLLTFSLWENLWKQEQAGWMLDQPYINRCIHMLDRWIGRIDRALESAIPMTLAMVEKKVGGEYSYVKKPFLKSGDYTAQVYRNFPGSEFQNDWDLVGGPFSRVEYRPVNLNSNDETKNWLLASGWIPSEWNTDSAGNKTSPKMSKGEKFEGVDGKMGKLIVKRVQSRHRRSQMQGWLERVRTDGRIATRVSGIAETRRMKHADVVNVPNGEAFFGKQMRRAFTSRDGWVIVSADAANCQDRFLANRAGDDAFTKMLLEGDKDAGTDSHTLTMVACNKVFKLNKLAEITRNKAKGFGFAFKFGASDKKLGAMQGASKEIGEQIRASLREMFPALAALIDRLTSEWRSNAKKRVNRWGKTEYYQGSIKALDGTPIFIESEHAVLVYAVQSDEAVYMSAVYNTVHKYLAKRFKWGEDYVVVCFYHDEISVECKEGLAQEVAGILEKAFADMSKYFKLDVPQVGSAQIGKNWYEVH